MMRVLIIDNYDSFTFNLLHAIEQPNVEITVHRNDAFDLEIVNDFDKVVISPGPGLPKQAGHTMDVIRKYAKSKPILGVCLGCQAMAEVLGAKLGQLNNPLHGISSKVSIVRSHYIFEDVPTSIEVGHYHSWIVENDKNLTKHFKVLAVNNGNLVMAIAHKMYDLVGIQFHPESILTMHGQKMLSNWLNH